MVGPNGYNTQASQLRSRYDHYNMIAEFPRPLHKTLAGPRRQGLHGTYAKKKSYILRAAGTLVTASEANREAEP